MLVAINIIDTSAIIPPTNCCCLALVAFLVAWIAHSLLEYEAALTHYHIAINICPGKHTRYKAPPRDVRGGVAQERTENDTAFHILRT